MSIRYYPSAYCGNSGLLDKNTPLLSVSDIKDPTVLNRSVDPENLRGGVILEMPVGEAHNLLWLAGPPVIENDIMPTIPQKELLRHAVRTLTSHPLVIPYIYSQMIWRVKNEETKSLSSMENSDYAVAVYLEGEPYVFAFQAEPSGIYLNVAVKQEIGCFDWTPGADDVLYIRKDGSFTIHADECPVVHTKNEK